MGTILTSYGEAGYGHEGYAAQVLDDGTLTATYSTETEARMLGQIIAACECGWTGAAHYPCPEPFDEQAHDLALAEWKHDHARPVLEDAQRGDLGRLQRLLRDLGVAAEFPAARPVASSPSSCSTRCAASPPRPSWASGAPADQRADQEQSALTHHELPPGPARHRTPPGPAVTTNTSTRRSDH